MFPLRPVRPAESRALLVSVLRKLDQITLDAYTPNWTRPTTAR
jgi:hypothetical protein